MIVFFWFVVSVTMIGVCVVIAKSIASEKEKINALEHFNYERTAFEFNRDKLFNELTSGWRYRALAVIDQQDGIIAMDADGASIRLVTLCRDAASCMLEKDEILPMAAVRQVAIHQPKVAKTIIHNETMPVAVGNGRSPGSRALVGGLIAGEAGAIVGGMSGMGGKTKIQHVAVKRHETVYRKAHPTLILHVNDLTRPRRSITFDTVATTNDWSSRLHHAIHR